MTDAGARRKAPTLAGSADPLSSTPLSSSLRLMATAAICGALAGCSAHERGVTTAQTPATAEQTALAEGAPAAAPAVVASAPAAPGQPGGAQVAVAPGATPATAAAVVPLPVASSKPSLAVSKVATAGKVGRSGGGLASWYGDRFHGRSTANGERFDMGGFTAAHRSFPLPSYVRVTNVSNGRSIVVRVNDRGPFHGGRVIDVSRRAADVLGFRSGGVGNVKLDLIGPAPDGRSDDRRLLASYQEFGRPAAAPGEQVAMGPVSDQDLAGEAMGYGGRAYAVASLAVTKSASFVKSSAVAVASGASNLATSGATAVASVMPTLSKPKPAKSAPAVAAAPTALASAQPEPATPAAYAASAPALASAPAAILSGPTSKPRVVTLAEPVLASSAPAPTASTPAVRTASADVTSRIAASFDSFDSFAPRLGSSQSR